ncbi:GntR family transcriptional regulator, partial [Streptomyces roseolus]|uniref:GntR family transcriptional regulator n=1 Tax=Streptomyces roseolus TaxID=67358 RepID=UPI0036524FD3
MTAIVIGAVALFCALMHERSSVAELAKTLKAELDRYSPGGKLPSSRALVERHHVSPVTVTRALAQLAAEGLVVTRPGAGAFKAEAPAPAATGDTSWQELALSADAATELVPRAVDAAVRVINDRSVEGRAAAVLTPEGERRWQREHPETPLEL